MVLTALQTVYDELQTSTMTLQRLHLCVYFQCVKGVYVGVF